MFKFKETENSNEVKEYKESENLEKSGLKLNESNDLYSKEFDKRMDSFEASAADKNVDTKKPSFLQKMIDKISGKEKSTEKVDQKSEAAEKSEYSDKSAHDKFVESLRPENYENYQDVKSEKKNTSGMPEDSERVRERTHQVYVKEEPKKQIDDDLER